MTNVHHYGLEKAEAQSDTAWEADMTSFQSPSEAAEWLAELIAAADAAVELADQARMAAYGGASAGRRGGGAAVRRARRAKAAYERALAAARRAVQAAPVAEEL